MVNSDDANLKSRYASISSTSVIRRLEVEKRKGQAGCLDGDTTPFKINLVLSAITGVFGSKLLSPTSTPALDYRPTFFNSKYLNGGNVSAAAPKPT